MKTILRKGSSTRRYLCYLGIIKVIALKSVINNFYVHCNNKADFNYWPFLVVVMKKHPIFSSLQGNDGRDGQSGIPGAKGEVHERKLNLCAFLILHLNPHDLRFIPSRSRCSLYCQYRMYLGAKNLGVSVAWKHVAPETATHTQNFQSYPVSCGSS